MSIGEYTVGLARRKHIDMLPEIERAAAALFPEDVLPPEIRADVIPEDELEAARREQRLWTAVTKAGSPVGFALVIHDPDSVFLQEIDVHPAHQRNGLGRRLIDEVISRARADEFSCITLTTFEHVAWNAPFYSRLGFRKLEAAELGKTLRERLQAEMDAGLRQRVAMQLTLCNR
ncbi:MAG: GNAT family N-acetyltransferase [Pseudomonadales bacterium]